MEVNRPLHSYAVRQVGHDLLLQIARHLGGTALFEGRARRARLDRDVDSCEILQGIRKAGACEGRVPRAASMGSKTKYGTVHHARP